jgi:hypothetical protein
VYSRSLDGAVLTIAASGWTYNEGAYNLFVLRDYETGSLWYQIAGTDELTCIAGELEGKTLPELASSYTPWNQWKGDYAETLVLPTRGGRPE